MKRILVLLLASLVLLTVACGAEEAPTATSASAAVPAPMPAPAPPKGAPGAATEGFAVRDAVSQPAEERLIVRTASLSLVVDDLGDTLGQIEALAGQLEGYVVSSSRHEDKSASISIRVPAEQFPQAMSEMRGMAVRVENESTQSRDVTEEYVDLESRLRNLEASEEQLLTFLERTEKLEDVVAVFRELSSVRERIEVTKGRMQYLERTSAMSIINISLRPVSSPEPVVKPGWSAWETVKDAARGLSGLGQGLAGAGIWVVVFAPVWLPVLLIVFFVGRRLLHRL
ncbi:MAG: DUF4349 domain-containing protein [Dehalococcoidia bacterium]